MVHDSKSFASRPTVSPSIAHTLYSSDPSKRCPNRSSGTNFAFMTPLMSVKLAMQYRTPCLTSSARFASTRSFRSAVLRVATTPPFLRVIGSLPFRRPRRGAATPPRPP